jgi:hypothetical protein
MKTAELHAGERAAEDIDAALAAEAQRVKDAKRRVVERIIEAKTHHNRSNVAIANTLGITEGAVRAMIKRTQL